MPTVPTHAVRLAVQRAAVESDTPLLLAVSGGLDSMVLLSAMEDVARGRACAVATFDHGTGPAGLLAVDLVRKQAGKLGVTVVAGRQDAPLAHPDGREAAWREARWRFLRETADRFGARIVTAHTEDDQVETVLMRTLRGSGARGLAGLYAESAVVRPFIGLRRHVLQDYARTAGVPWVEDPSNQSREFLRNRMRHDLLPTLRGADASFEPWLLSLARRAAALRGDVDAFVRDVIRPARRADGSVVVNSLELRDYDADCLAMLWGAIAAHAGVALDRRGTRRLASFTRGRPRVGTVPLSGGWCLEARRDSYILRHESARAGPMVALPARGSLTWGRFRFRVATGGLPSSPWSAAVDGAASLHIRPWAAGDRLESAGGQPRRRVTRYLSDAGVQGQDRASWPVVVAGDDVVWIPGVRRSDAATDRSGRPVRHYVCERIDG